uniref:Uncharacterized protein n=1 Tax=Ciona intestinalis TaxID=7719 RepID=F6YCN1_CIOIN
MNHPNFQTSCLQRRSGLRKSSQMGLKCRKTLQMLLSGPHGRNMSKSPHLLTYHHSTLVLHECHTFSFSQGR